jgi:hypothetical protein
MSVVRTAKSPIRAGELQGQELHIAEPLRRTPLIPIRRSQQPSSRVCHFSRCFDLPFPP